MEKVGNLSLSVGDNSHIHYANIFALFKALGYSKPRQYSGKQDAHSSFSPGT